MRANSRNTQGKGAPFHSPNTTSYRENAKKRRSNINNSQIRYICFNWTVDLWIEN
jgi:hypothetical protein